MTVKHTDSQPVLSSKGALYASIKERVLCKNVDATRHFLRRPPAIAIETYIWETYRSEFDFVEVKDRATGVRWRIATADMASRGFARQTLGYEPQWAVPLGAWETILAFTGQTSPVSAPAVASRPVDSPAPPRPPRPATGSLFE